jgi:hypothetical protein
MYPAHNRVPVTTVQSVLKMKLEERLPIYRVAAKILNKQPRTYYSGRTYNWEVGRRVNNAMNVNIVTNHRNVRLSLTETSVGYFF